MLFAYNIMKASNIFFLIQGNAYLYLVVCTYSYSKDILMQLYKLSRNMGKPLILHVSAVLKSSAYSFLSAKFISLPINLSTNELFALYDGCLIRS